MTYKARFVHGSRYFNLDAGEFDLFQDFIFPAAEEALNISTPNVGSMSGGRVVSKTPQDRWWAWSVMITGESNAQTHMAARRLSAWLSQSIDDKTDKVYFEYTPNYVMPAPVWGQYGAPYRFEVKAAIVDLDGSYYVADIPSKALIVPISLLVGPHALGARQLLAQAKGAVKEDTYGVTDGISRGTIVCAGFTNLVANPSFETNTTGWTAAGCTIEQTTEQAWVGSYGLRQTVSATNTAAVAVLAGNTGAPLAQQNYTASARVYIPDHMIGKSVQLFLYETGGASAAETTATHNTSFTTGGWQYMYCSGTVKKADRTTLQVYLAINASATTLAGSWVIWDAIQLVQNTTVIHPYIDGDMIGCVWTGTAHASTSTSTAGYIRLATSGALKASGGAIRLAVKHLEAAAGHSYDRVLFSDGKISAFLENSTAEYYFTDGTNTISGGAAQTFAAGEIQVLHFVWSAAGLKTYLNGAAYDSGTVFTPWALGDYLYIGSNATPAGHSNTTFLCPPELFDQPLTAAQVAADYANISPHIRGGDGYGQRLSGMPYLWTKDGDNVVDNCTDATRNHYAIAAGIQGTTEAETEIGGVAGTLFGGIHLSNFVTRRYFNPSIFFVDSSGTADAAAVGGEAHVTATGQSSIELAQSGMSWYKYQYPEFSAMEFYVLARMKAASAIYSRIQPYVASSGYVVNTSTDLSPIYSLATTYRLFRTNAGITERNFTGYDTGSEYVQVYGYVSAGTVNVSLDYAVMFPRPYLYCFTYKTSKFTLNNKSLVVESGAPFAGMINALNPIGDPIEFSPNRYNILQSLMGSVSDDPSLSYTLTYVIYVTPRYRLT